MLRRAKELAERVDAEEEAERAASVSSPATGDELGAGDEASATLPAAIEVERAAAPAPSTAHGASEPLEDGIDEEIDVEATLRLKRSSSAAAAAPAPAAPAPAAPMKEEEPLEREEQAVQEREAKEDAPSESGTEEFLVV
jgi:hypothetical protein